MPLLIVGHKQRFTSKITVAEKSGILLYSIYLHEIVCVSNRNSVLMRDPHRLNYDVQISKIYTKCKLLDYQLFTRSDKLLAFQF